MSKDGKEISLTIHELRPEPQVVHLRPVPAENIRPRPDESIAENIDEQNAGRRADSAWETIGKAWESWLLVGKWFVIARNNAMKEAGTSRPKGRGYNQAFSRRLQERRFRNNLADSDRKRLFDCMQHREAIEAWRATLTDDQRRRFNHPTTVWRRWQAATKIPDVTKPKAPSPMAKLKAANRELQEELYATKEALHQAAKRVGAEGPPAADHIGPALAEVLRAEGIEPGRVKRIVDHFVAAFCARGTTVH